MIKEENFVGAGANAEDVFGNMIEGHNNDAEAHANIRKAIGNALNVHAKDNILHVTTEEKRKWDNAAETAKREAQSVAGEIRQDMEDLEERVELKIESKAYHESTGSYAEIFNDYENNVADGDYSHAEGANTIAEGDYSHAEGHKTVAKGRHSHAEGANTIAEGGIAHAEGYNSSAIGIASHAEGQNTVANGFVSHAEGYETIANGFYQHAGGKFNAPDDKALIIIGNGTSETDRRNAYTLDENGNAIYSGHVTAKKFCDVNGNDMKDICSNALKATASGKTICAYDVSPIEHQAKVQVASKNILNVNHAPIVHTNPVAKAYRWERTETGFRAQFIKEMTSNSLNHGYVIGKTEDFKGKTITVSYGEAILNPDANPTITVMLTQKKGVLYDSFDETMGFLGDGYTGAGGTNMLIKNNYNNAKTQNYVTATIPNDSDAETYPYVMVAFYIGQGCDNPADSVVEYKNIQVEIGDAMTAYEPWVDATTVMVRKFAKNLIPYPFAHFSNSNTEELTAVDNGDGGVLLNGTVTKDTYIRLSYVRLFSKSITSISANGFIANRYNDNVWTAFDANNNATFISVRAGTTLSNALFYPQIEVGNESTEYEKGMPLETFAPTADGMVDIMSVAPTMTLLPDTEGIIIEVTYNKDINKAIEELTNAIISLGGNV